jgi:hypothetical protein
MRAPAVMKDPSDITPCLALDEILRTLSGLVLVHRPTMALLRRLDLLAPVPERRILLFFDRQPQALKMRKLLGEARVTWIPVLLGDVPLYAPLGRRTAAAVVAPLPHVEESEQLRFIRKAAGVLRGDGMLVLHSRLRGKISGMGEHLGRILFTDGTGLPDELALASLAVRGGFSRLEKKKLGRLGRRTFILARKSSL